MSEEKESLAESVMTYLPLTKRVRVLVVDGDAACLAIVSRMLFIFGYKVLTATTAADAFSIVHDEEDDLQLVLAEVHLPDMNKYEFLEKMGEVSKLPVVIMSDDDDEIEMLGGLFKGAQFYFVKPLTMNNIKNLWQFAAIKYNTNEDEVSDSDGDEEEEEEEDNVHISDLSPEEKHCVSNEDVDDNMLIINKEMQIHNNDDKRKREGEAENDKDKEEDNDDDDDDDDDNLTANSKKAKLVLSDELHERFLQAVSALGIEGAHPKEILQHINVPGLTKENISTHLQKFRLYVKHEQDTARKTMTKDCAESGMGVTNSKELACFGEEESELVKDEKFNGEMKMTNVWISDVGNAKDYQNLLSNSTEQPQQQEQPQIPLAPPPPQKKEKQEEEDMFDFTKGSTMHFRDEDLDDFW